eukprot:952052-Heterocapsa_arctica.AAC.1
MAGGTKQLDSAQQHYYSQILFPRSDLDDPTGRHSHTFPAGNNHNHNQTPQATPTEPVAPISHQHGDQSPSHSSQSSHSDSFG